MSKYKDKRGRIVTVNNIDGNIAVLDNHERVALERLNDPNHYTRINNSNNSNTSTVVESNNNTLLNENNINNRYERMLKNKSIDIRTEDEGQSIFGNETQYIGQNGRPVTANSSIRMDSDVVERKRDNVRNDVVERREQYPTNNSQNNQQLSKEEELLRKYNFDNQKEPKYSDSLVKYSDEYNPEIHDNKQSEENIYKPSGIPEKEYIREPKKEINPVHQMFEKAKKTKTIKLSINISEKIPNKDVIKMMEENFEESSIDYYAKSIYRKLMKNPEVLEKQIVETIKKYVNTKTRKTTPSSTKK